MHESALRRLDGLRALMSRHEIPALLISSPVNVSYLTRFSGDSTCLIVLPDREIAITDDRYRSQINLDCAGLEVVVRPVGQGIWDAVAGVVEKLSVSRLAFEANVMTVAAHEALTGQLARTHLRGCVGMVETLRQVKDAEEIQAIRDAVQRAETAFEGLSASLDPSWTELEAAQALEQRLREGGSESPAFETIVAAGPSSAFPHARPGSRNRLADWSFLLVDWGATVGGYRSDLTRMIFTGTVAREFREIYQAVLAAHDQAIASIRPGRLAGEIDAKVRRVLDEAGFGTLFGHGTGHGLGREIHEAPWIRPHSTEVLEPGMIFTVEPGVYSPGLGGVRIEDDVLVTPDGVEVLSHLPRDPDAIGLLS